MNTAVINGSKQVGADGDRDSTTVPSNQKGSSPIDSQSLIGTKAGWQQQHFSSSTIGGSSNIEGFTNVSDSAEETTSSLDMPDLNPFFNEEYAPLAKHKTKIDLSSPIAEIDNSGVLPEEVFSICSAHEKNDIPLPASSCSMKQKGSPPYDARNFKYPSPSPVVLTPKKEIADDFNSLQDDASPIRYSSDQKDHVSLPTLFGKRGTPPSYVIRPRSYHTHKKNLNGRRGPSLSENIPAAEPFDICQCEEICELELLKQDTSSNMCELEFLKQDTSSNMCDLEPVEEVATDLLRPGMVLLRSFLTKAEQIDIVKKCRDIGIGPGGFCQPGFANGAKLRLQMMCFGLDWDPQTRRYNEKRQHDGSNPPAIPQEFDSLVRSALCDAHAIIKGTGELSRAEAILPTMSPNICIANFYTTTGRLGLHQDRDESQESLHNKRPVVSFSIGDSAEFLYGDARDTDKAKRVILKSGDVLIFGGESRHIFHGVKSIIPNSAPKFLLEESRLRPGRLNLTFRQY